jgi:hypothetical protein
MNHYKILTQHNPWLIIFCIVAGLGYAYLLYQKKSPWSKNINLVLAALRGTLVALLAFLLLGPLIKYFKNYAEKPAVVIAVDNSQSISLSENNDRLNAFRQNLEQTRSKLAEASIESSIQTFDHTALDTSKDSLLFHYPSSNLSRLLLDIQSNYENRNLAGVILVSDGIYNQGASPDFARYNFPLYTAGLGDTVPKVDLNLKALSYNKLSYKNNKFPIQAEIHNKGFAGQTTQIVLKQGSKIIETKTLAFKSQEEINTVEFYTSSSETGMQHYVVEIKPLREEFTLRNNSAHAYIDVIENKEKILLIAAAPHPDIKALRAAIEQKENYEFHLHIPGFNEFKNDRYDLVILHQLPDVSGTARAVLEKLQKDESTSILYILGPQTNLNTFNSQNKVLSIASRQGQRDFVTTSFNTSFDRFSIDKEEQAAFGLYPPVPVPYGDYSLKGSADVLMYQKIGNVVSSRPLLVSSTDRKQAVLAGEGIWQWRQHEFLETNDSKSFDRFFGNLVQYLSSKEDKRKFRVYPVSNEMLISESVLFETELYNDLYENVYGQKIDLKITNEEGVSTTYAYANSEHNSRFEVKGLPQGVYRYTATTQAGSKTEKSEGRFTIKEIMLEALQTTADHELLRQLAHKNKGAFVAATSLPLLADSIIASKPKNILHTNEELIELISMPWLFFLLLALASVEWFVRKYNGGY